MLNNDACFPYPVLRQKPEDYKTTVFNDDHKIEAGMDCFHVRTHFSVNNHQIRELIDQEIISYALYISCPSTLYRRLEFIHAITDYRIPAGDVHFKVEVTPCIVVKKPVEHFVIDDFQEDFQGIDFSLSTGDIAGLGSTHSFDALYDPDIIKDGASIVDITESDGHFMEVEYDGPHIVVKLPADQYRNYKECEGVNEKYDLLHSVLTIPVLVQAISLIAQQEEDDDNIYVENAWFSTLTQKMKHMAHTSDEYSKMLEDPVTTAERIMADNSARSLLKINQGEF